MKKIELNPDGQNIILETVFFIFINLETFKKLKIMDIK